jgi:hypothetical protein
MGPAEQPPAVPTAPVEPSAPMPEGGAGGGRGDLCVRFPETCSPAGESETPAPEVTPPTSSPNPEGIAVAASRAVSEHLAASRSTFSETVWGPVRNFLFSNGKPSAAAIRAEEERARNRRQTRAGSYRNRENFKTEIYFKVTRFWGR